MMDMDIPPGWEWSAQTIIDRKLRKVMVLGSVDSGKSTYCGYLARRIMEAGADAALVDADVGQKDVGPPGCITLGLFHAASGSLDSKPAAFYFVGAVSPMKHLLPMVVGAGSLAHASRAPFVLINTTGLIHGVGRILKGYKIEAVRPDAIVAIQKGRELESILRAYRNHNVLRIPRSERAAAKTPEARKEARETAFHRYFEDAPEISVELPRLIFQRTLLFSGKPVAGPDSFIHFEKTPEGVLAVGKKPEGQDYSMNVLPRGFEENLLCGLADSRNRGVGLALIKHIDFTARTIHLITPVSPFIIRVLQPGDLYLTREGRELNRRWPGHL
jgi:polynucleotide 5'-hydroxyl-kinase GRC3/NOL9